MSTLPKSLIVNKLVAAQPATDRCYALSDNQLGIHHLRAPSERRVLTTVAELRDTCESTFLLTS
jgi:N-hydroxyarylamine O-acetyltransferase